MLTLPLLPGTDGRKMSKSYDNAVEVAGSSRDMYGKIMRISDAEIPVYLQVACMLMEAHRVAALLEDYRSGGRNPIEVKEAIAHHVVGLYHGAEVAGAEQAWFREHIRGRQVPDDLPVAEVSNALFTADPTWPGLLTGLGLMASKGEVRRLIQGGGLKLDGERITDPSASYDGQDGRVLQYGKRRFVKLRYLR